MSKFEYNGMVIECDTSDFYEGLEVVLFVNGQKITRKVRDCKDGLYVTVKGIKIFYEDFN